MKIVILKKHMIGLEDTQYTFQSSVGEAREVAIILF